MIEDRGARKKEGRLGNLEDTYVGCRRMFMCCFENIYPLNIFQIRFNNKLFEFSHL
jgi:hypothetical protein